MAIPIFVNQDKIFGFILEAVDDGDDYDGDGDDGEDCDGDCMTPLSFTNGLWTKIYVS